MTAALGLVPIKVRRFSVPTAHGMQEPAPRYFFERQLTTKGELQQSFALRFQVYCRERRFLDERNFPGGIESDHFDPASLHFGSYDRAGELVGTVRLVAGCLANLPMLEHCQLDPEPLERLSRLPQLVEISRLAISRAYRRRAGDGAYGIADIATASATTAGAIEQRQNKYAIVFTLYRAMYRAAKRRSIRHVVAAMEASLYRIMAHHRFPFRQIGPAVDYYGPVMPFYLDLERLDRELGKYNPEMLKYFNHVVSEEICD